MTNSIKWGRVYKPAVAIAALSILVGGYAFAIACKLIPNWLVVVLAPFAVISAIIVTFLLGGYVVLLAAFVSDYFVDLKEKFLLKYGAETQAVIAKVERYYGPGLHAGDPCFRGNYCFTDHRGIEHSHKFSRECYDPYDLNLSGISIGDYYQEGRTRRLIYWKWFPAIHHLYGPEVNASRLHGKLGLFKLE